jgi:hypothetical protein
METTKQQRLNWYKLGLIGVEYYGPGACTCVRLSYSDTVFKEMMDKLYRLNEQNSYYSNSFTLLPELHTLRTTPLGFNTWFCTHEERVAALKQCIEQLEGEIKEEAVIKLNEKDERTMQIVIPIACVVLIGVLALVLLNIT